MMVKEAQERRKALEWLMRDHIQRFELETGLVVSDIRLIRVETVSGAEVVELRCEVTLPP